MRWYCLENTNNAFIMKIWNTIRATERASSCHKCIPTYAQKRWTYQTCKHSLSKKKGSTNTSFYAPCTWENKWKNKPPKRIEHKRDTSSQDHHTPWFYSWHMNHGHGILTWESFHFCQSVDKNKAKNVIIHAYIYIIQISLEWRWKIATNIQYFA